MIQKYFGVGSESLLFCLGIKLFTHGIGLGDGCSVLGQCFDSLRTKLGWNPGGASHKDSQRCRTWVSRKFPVSERSAGASGSEKWLYTFYKIWHHLHWTWAASNHSNTLSFPVRISVPYSTVGKQSLVVLDPFNAGPLAQRSVLGYDLQLLNKKPILTFPFVDRSRPIYQHVAPVGRPFTILLQFYLPFATLGL